MNTNANAETNERGRVGQFRPNMCFYHANPKGTGSAVKMNLHPAHDTTDGCVMLTIANQKSIGDRRAERPTFPTFDWENAICVKLDFNDLTQILQVFRGECESINEGKGLYHVSSRGATSIRLAHLVEPVSGYMLDICRKANRGDDDGVRARFLFGTAEALGLCEAIAGSLYLICFGIPMLVPHDTSAYRAEAREKRDVFAA